MPNSNQYKLLRTGNVSSGRAGRYRESAHVLAPNIEEFGHQPFTAEHLQKLAKRMQDPAWPRGALNIYELEGLFTALLVLSLGLRPTVWLPLVWNETGWKVPVALQKENHYREFLELITGFLRAIDAGLQETPPRFSSALETLQERYPSKTLQPHQDWALGFGLAMNQSNFLNTVIDPIAHRALYAIAVQTKTPSIIVPQRGVAQSFPLRQAVLVLASKRVARGPLGALPV
jgi:yecA family protein